MKIEVTQEDIIKGIRHAGDACPIALATKRTLGIGKVDVARDSICVQVETPHDQSEDIHLPQEASDFIEMFDLGEPVYPFSFEIDYER